jgi:hypothetical protein
MCTRLRPNVPRPTASGRRKRTAPSLEPYALNQWHTQACRSSAMHTQRSGRYAILSIHSAGSLHVAMINRSEIAAPMFNDWLEAMTPAIAAPLCNLLYATASKVVRSCVRSTRPAFGAQSRMRSSDAPPSWASRARSTPMPLRNGPRVIAPWKSSSAAKQIILAEWALAREQPLAKAHHVSGARLNRAAQSVCFAADVTPCTCRRERDSATRRRCSRKPQARSASDSFGRFPPASNRSQTRSPPSPAECGYQPPEPLRLRVRPEAEWACRMPACRHLYSKTRPAPWPHLGHSDRSAAEDSMMLRAACAQQDKGRAFKNLADELRADPRLSPSFAARPRRSPAVQLHRDRARPAATCRGGRVREASHPVRATRSER